MNIWVKYDGGYQKEFCSIRTRDGKEYTVCWPNAGVFHVMSEDEPLQIDEKEVDGIRYLTQEECDNFVIKLRD